MTIEKTKILTLNGQEIQDVLKQDQEIDKTALYEKLKSFNLKQYPRYIYNLDDLKNVYKLDESVYDQAKSYIERRNAERVLKAHATRTANQKAELKKVILEQSKREQSKLETGASFESLQKLYTQQAKLKLQLAKLLQEQNLLNKEILDIEKKLNVL